MERQVTDDDHGNRPTSYSNRLTNRKQPTNPPRHESDLKDNVYWLGLLTHLQVRPAARCPLACLKPTCPRLTTKQSPT